MDDKEKSEWMERLRTALDVEEVDEGVFDNLERRLSSFKDLCGSPFGRSEADLDRDFPEPPAGETAYIDFDCLPIGEAYYGRFSAEARYLFRNAGGRFVDGFVHGRFADGFVRSRNVGRSEFNELLALMDAGDEKALALFEFCVRYILRPAYLYVLLRLSQKVDEAFAELSTEAVAAVMMHVWPELVGSEPKDGLPPVGEPSSWTETVRRDSYQAVKNRLKPFSVSARPKPDPDSVLGRALANFRAALEKRLGGPVDDKTFASHLTVKALDEYSGVSRSTFRRRFKESVFNGDIGALKRSFSDE
jgi:hypothetical protein